MPTIAELATATITPATTRKVTALVDAVADVFRTFAEAVIAAARRIADAIVQFTLSLSPAKPVAHSYPGREAQFARRGRKR